MVVIVKQSRLLGGTLASSLGQGVYGTRAENGASCQCNKTMSGDGREETIHMSQSGDGMKEVRGGGE